MVNTEAKKLYFEGAYRYRLPLKQAFQVRPGLRVDSMDSIFLKYIDDANNNFLGELNQVAGVHQHSLEDAVELIRRSSRHKLIELNRFENIFEHLGQLDLEADYLRPAFDQILWQHYYSEKPTFSEKQLSALLSFERKDWRERFQLLGEFSNIKVKLGRLSWKDEFSCLVELADLLESSQKLRLDANQSLTLEQVMSIETHLDVNKIDYVEEPFSDLSPFWKAYQGKLRLAFDESLWEKKAHRIDRDFPIALVLKPAKLGLSGCLAWIKMNPSAMHVLSSCFESAWGLQFLVEFAQYQNITTPLGLGTHCLFVKDELFSSLKLDQARLNWQIFEIPDLSCCERIC